MARFPSCRTHRGGLALMSLWSVIWHALAAEKDSPGRQRAAIPYTHTGGSNEASDPADLPVRDAGTPGSRVSGSKLVVEKPEPRPGALIEPSEARRERYSNGDF